LASSELRDTGALPTNFLAGEALGVSDRAMFSYYLVRLPRMRPPSSWSGSICHLPPPLGGTA